MLLEDRIMLESSPDMVIPVLSRRPRVTETLWSENDDKYDILPTRLPKVERATRSHSASVDRKSEILPSSTKAATRMTKSATVIGMESPLNLNVEKKVNNAQGRRKKRNNVIEEDSSSSSQHNEMTVEVQENPKDAILTPSMKPNSTNSPNNQEDIRPPLQEKYLPQETVLEKQITPDPTPPKSFPKEARNGTKPQQPPPSSPHRNLRGGVISLAQNTNYRAGLSKRRRVEPLHSYVKPKAV